MNATAFSPLSPAFTADPYPTYANLRALDRPEHSNTTGMVMLARYGDVAAIATNPTMVRSLEGLETEAEAKARQREANWHDMPFHERFVQFSLLDSDGDIHRRLRKLIFGQFTARAVAPLEDMVRAYVDGLLNQLIGAGEIDFISDFAAHVPGHVIGHLLGAPAEDAPTLRRWSEEVVQFFDVDRTDAKKALAENATRDFAHYLEDLKRERERTPRNDLISAMMEDERAGHFQGDEFISTCMLILMAGHGSTIDVLGSSLHTLLKNPDVMAELRKDHTLLPNAIQEMFRYESPLPFFHRHALEDVTIRGHHFPAGTTFGLLYGAANRDPDAFDEPDRFNIHRSPNRHLAFGQGAHLCLGNHLARLNMKVIYEQLFARTTQIDLAGPVPYKPGLSVRGPKSLPVRLNRS